MNLSDHDLRQINEIYLDSLPETELREVSKKLYRDLKEARARLNQNPDNSSRPPSTRAPWEHASGLDTSKDDDKSSPEEPEQSPGSEAGQGKNVSTASDCPPDSPNDNGQKSKQARKKPGKQEGAPGHGHKVELAVTHEKHHKPEYCAACSRIFDEQTEFNAWNGRYELELEVNEGGLAGLRVQHIKHVYYRAVCGCGHETREEPGRCQAEADSDWSVEVTEWHLCGPNLVSLIVCLSKELHVSRQKIARFMREWFNIHLCVGVINQCIHEAGRAAEPVVTEQLIPELLKSKLLYIDETPWKQVKLMLWLLVLSLSKHGCLSPAPRWFSAWANAIARCF
jgi:transposase